MHKRKRRSSRRSLGVNLVYVGLVLGLILIAIVALLVVSGIRLPSFF